MMERSIEVSVVRYVGYYKVRMDVKTSLQTGDAHILRKLLAEDPLRADRLIRWGGRKKCVTHPLHYVSDLVFEGTLRKGKAVPLVDVLLECGSNPDFQKNGNGETPLIGAASLGAEDVGLRLLDAGARPELRGMFGETALHWAALLGEHRLAARLIPGSDLNLKDDQYKSTPLGWAVHGWSNPPAGNQGGQREVIVQLVDAGAIVEPQMREEIQRAINGVSERRS